MTLVIFYPKMKKEEKQNIYSTVAKVIFFCLWACGPARPAASPRVMQVEKVSPPCDFY